MNPKKIQQLYESEARAMLDEDLLDEIAYGLYVRCLSIMEVTRAHDTKTLLVTCPVCSNKVKHRGWYEKDYIIRCDCGWSLPWTFYRKSYRGKQLTAGGSVPQITGYIEQFPLAKTSQQKMYLIDSLIHSFHWELQGNCTRPTARNFIYGNMNEIVTLLMTLTYGEHTPPERMTERDRWLVHMYKGSAWALPDEYRDKT